MIYIYCIHTNGNIISILSYILICSCKRHPHRNIYRNKKGLIAQSYKRKQLMKCIFSIQKRLWMRNEKENRFKNMDLSVNNFC